MPIPERTAGELRRRAEESLMQRQALPGASEPNTQRLIHELQVHQIELEMQNEELLQANRNLALLRDEYRDLFDYSPIGYFKLPYGNGEMQMNMALKILLGLPIDSGVKMIAPYIAVEDRKVWSDCLTRLRLNRHRDECRLQLITETGQIRYVEVFLTNFVTMHGGAIFGAVVPINEEAYRES
jgi:hypothetical protein